MSDVRCKISLVLLLLCISLTTAAEDFLMRGCRRGVLPSTTMLRSRRAAATPRQVGGSFYTGDRRQLVVLVSFSDLQFSDSDPVAAWNPIFNQPDYTQPPFYGSIHDYFYAQSDGRLCLTFDLHYVAFSHSRERYASTQGDDENSQYLISDVVDTLLTRDIDWSPYDWDGNGYVNQVLIVYAGYGMNDGGDDKTIWPHQWWLSLHLKDYHVKGHAEGVYCEPRRVTSGGRDYYVDTYCALQEYAMSTKYGSFGTIVHEYTHCFGFPDFYNGSSSYVGHWDLMDRGNNNGGGFCPPNYSAHERWLMGWCTPTELTTTQTVTAMDASQSYLVRNDGYSDEYYVVENRQQVGWDRSLPASGLVVLHVDFKESAWLGLSIVDGEVSYEAANTSSLKRYTIFPANNKSYYTTGNEAGWAYPYESNNQLTNTSTPAAKLWNANSDGTLFMNKPITNMDVQDGKASFDFMKSATDIGIQTVTDVAQVLCEYGPIRIVRTADGTVKKVMKR